MPAQPAVLLNEGKFEMPNIKQMTQPPLSASQFMSVDLLTFAASLPAEDPTGCFTTTSQLH